MAEVTVKKCDVFDVIKKVEVETITIARHNSDTGEMEIIPFTVDMCERAHKRLVAFVERATKPPVRKDAESEADEAARQKGSGVGSGVGSRGRGRGRGRPRVGDL